VRLIGYEVLGYFAACFLALLNFHTGFLDQWKVVLIKLLFRFEFVLMIVRLFLYHLSLFVSYFLV
jgi:hypothetical protein